MAETILIVDDEPTILEALGKTLEDEGYQIALAKSGSEALKTLRTDPPDLMLLDNWMPEMDGLETLRQARQQYPHLLVIMITADDKIDTVVKAVKLGAYDYMVKPPDDDILKFRIRRALDQRKLEEENLSLRIKVERHFEMVGNSPAMQRLRQLIAVAGPTSSRVLISGENGTGKELVARAIHLQSSRRERPFVEVNCAAIPETLIESELFGHERGSFSGATSMKRGKFELADGGTLFLDEIGDMSLGTQAKVLRVLQEQQFHRVGGSKLIKVNVRVIAASNKNLPQEIQKGTFREDLFYRLNVLPIEVPPLRNRKADIPELGHHFLRVLAEEQGMKTKEISSEALEVLQVYDWPGNIRELRNLIERLMIMVPGHVIEASDAGMFLQACPTGRPQPSGSSQTYESLRDARNAFERDYISAKLRENNWNISKTADDLKIERSHLHRKIKLLTIDFRSDNQQQS